MTYLPPPFSTPGISGVLRVNEPFHAPATHPALREYQLQAVENLRAAIAAGRRRVLLVLPTGGGKTIIAAEIMRGAAEKGSRVLFIAHRRELINQTIDKLDQIDVRAGVIMRGDPRRAPWERVQVASIQTLVRRELPPADLIFIDEAHRARADSYNKILDQYPNAAVLGLTATPWRTDNRGLGELFNELVVASTPQQLLDLGFLVPLTGYVYDSPDLSGVKTTGGDYNEHGLELVMGEPKICGNIVEQWKLHAGGERTVVFAVTVSHSRDLVDRFRAEGVAAEHVDGSTPGAERAAILGRLRSGETRVLSNCGIVTEGYDLPSLGCCILARPTKSLALVLQMIGRVARPVCLACSAPADPRAATCSKCGSDRIKRSARIHDHAKNIIAHGLPYATRDYTLAFDRKKRDAPSVKTCPKCFAVYDPSVSEFCPECGPDESERPKETSRVQESPGVAMRLEDVGQLQEGEQFEFLLDAFRLRKARGWKDGYPLVAFKKKYGNWPPRQLTSRVRKLVDATHCAGCGATYTDDGPCPNCGIVTGAVG